MLRGNMLARHPGSRSAPLHLARLLALTGLGCGAAAPADPGLFPLAPPPLGPCQPSIDVVEHLEDPTALGFSAMDVLARLAGPRSMPLEWLEPPENDEYILDYGPERGSSGLTIDVRSRGGRVLLRQSVPRFDAPEDTTCDAATLEIPVEVGVRSDGLALDERFETSLAASVPYQGRITQQLVPRTLSGGLSFSRVLSLDPERSFWIRSLDLTALLWEGGSMGSIDLQLGGGYTRVAQDFRPLPAPEVEAPGLVAWPSTHGCGNAGRYLPIGAKVLGFSVGDVLERLGAPATRALTWSNGDVVAVTLEIEAPGAELCQELGDSLSFTAMLHARSEDQSLDVRLPVRIDAQGDQGELGSISVESSEPDVPLPIERPAARRPSLPVEGYRALLVALAWTRFGESDTGSLALRGVESAGPDPEGRFDSALLSDGRW